jgi:hypothetical protein
MKKINYIYILILWIILCGNAYYCSAQARVESGQYTSYVEPSERASIQDSLLKYNKIWLFIFEEHGESTVDTTYAPFYKKANYYSQKLQDYDHAIALEADRKKHLEKKREIESQYKIKLP